MKQKLFTLTAKDFTWDYYSGTGKGGQNRNKKQKCVRCTHVASNTTGKSEDERSLEQNKKIAFGRMAEQKSFQMWCRIEGLKRLGFAEEAEQYADRELLNTKVETFQDGKWVETPEMKITYQDIEWMD